MDQGAVLAQVGSARERVGQSIAQMETTEAELQAVLAAGGQRMSSLQERFNAFLVHVQEETARAAQAMDALSETVQGHEQWLRAEIARTTHEADDTRGLFGESGAAFGEATGVLKDNEQTIGDRVSANTTLYEKTRSSADEAHDAHATSLREAEVEIATAGRELGERETLQRDRITEQLDGPVATARSDFESRLVQAVEATRTAFDAQAEHVQSGASTNLDNLTASESDQRKALIGDLQAMSDALTQLGSLVSETSQTMMQGADQATELMQMTGVGVNTVIGLINNLQEIFNEIESAWD